eukprot:gnl/TRDRNA2_/TRDRNA2_88846_c0_seq2.p3 gnl/TRDRNA2_/TRDRNA2_88846_c0~~gnl/TRDRNA2_/TRDRNA2_88846_c0_seq2.p3  ORF type:complete len:124 (-),score=18.78 gnl/TRDRNA2_/TRDRNA2_88846_c0_seq2:107-478(-)
MRSEATTKIMIDPALIRRPRKVMHAAGKIDAPAVAQGKLRSPQPKHAFAKFAVSATADVFLGLPTTGVFTVTMSLELPWIALSCAEVPAAEEVVGWIQFNECEVSLSPLSSGSIDMGACHNCE